VLKGSRYINPAQLMGGGITNNKHGRTYFVQPVSDKAGYEVHGNWPYGRGLTFTVFGELVDAVDGGATSLATMAPEEDDGVLNVSVSFSGMLGEGNRAIEKAGVAAGARTLAEVSPMSRVDTRCLCSLDKDGSVLQAVLATSDVRGSKSLTMQNVTDFLKQLSDDEIVTHADREKELTGEVSLSPGFSPVPDSPNLPAGSIVPNISSEEEFQQVIANDPSMAASLPSLDRETAIIMIRRGEGDALITDIRSRYGKTPEADIMVEQVKAWMSDPNILDNPGA